MQTWRSFAQAVLSAIALTSVACPASDEDAAPAPDPIAVCIERCEADSDCLKAGRPLGRFCEGSACVTHECEEDADCVRIAGRFQLADPDDGLAQVAPCTANRDADDRCPSGEVCCRAGFPADSPMRRCLEGGLCTWSTPELEPCEAQRLVEVVRRDVEGNEVRICTPPGYEDAVCDPSALGGGSCIDACSSDAECESRSLGFVCKEGRCECDADEDCPSYTGGHCREGLCACDSVAECGRLFDGTEQSCEPRTSRAFEQ